VTAEKDTYTILDLSTVVSVQWGDDTETSQFLSVGVVKKRPPGCPIDARLTIYTISNEQFDFDFFDRELAEAFGAGLQLVVDDLTSGNVLDVAVANAVSKNLSKKKTRSFLLKKKAASPPKQSSYNKENCMSSEESFDVLLPLPHRSVTNLLPKTNSERNLNSSFEIKSLEPTTGSYRVSKLQRDLALTDSKGSYLDALIGRAHTSSYLVLPLLTNSTQRLKCSGHAQVLKDLQREKAIVLNRKSIKLGSKESTHELIEQLSDLLEQHFESGLEQNKLRCKEILLAASRTVIEGDVYSMCHQLLLGAPDVLLLPAEDLPERGTPIEIYVGGAIVSIESECKYKIVHLAQTEDTWAIVHARCSEHFHYAGTGLQQLEDFQDDDQQQSRSIRSVRLDFFAERD
jgi:hypothetical protein